MLRSDAINSIINVLPDSVRNSAGEVFDALISVEDEHVITEATPAALPLDYMNVGFDTSGLIAPASYTLDDGTDGQRIRFTLNDATQTVTITPAHALGFTAYTLRTAGETVEMQFNGTSWTKVGSTGPYLQTQETVAASGAISLLTDITHLDANAGALAMTLADGTIGQRKLIILVDATHAATITPATAAGFTAAVLNFVQDSLLLEFDGTSWGVVTCHGNVTFTGATYTNTQTASAAISLVTPTTYLDTNLGALAMTLADGVVGQRKRIVLVDATNAATITPAHAAGFTAAVLHYLQDAIEFEFDGTSWGVVSVHGNVTFTGADYTITQTASGAISLVTLTTYLDASGGALAMTLADGVIGQKKRIMLIDATNNATITPAHAVGWTQFVLDGTSDYLDVEFDGTAWNIVGYAAYRRTVAFTTAGAGPDMIPTYAGTVVMTTGGVHALGLADGDFIGQKLKVIMIVDGGDGTLAVANFTNPAYVAVSVLFDDVGDAAMFEWDGAAWQVIGSLTATVS